MDYRKTATIFKAFGDENRLQILKILSNGEHCACKLLDELNITQPTLSHHMKILLDADIVQGRKDGKWMHYSLSKEGIEAVMKLIQELTAIQCIDHQQPCCNK